MFRSSMRSSSGSSLFTSLSMLLILLHKIMNHTTGYFETVLKPDTANKNDDCSVSCHPVRTIPINIPKALITISYPRLLCKYEPWLLNNENSYHSCNYTIGGICLFRAISAGSHIPLHTSLTDFEDSPTVVQ